MASELSFSDEHHELRATLRAFLEDRSDEQAVREQMASDTGWDRTIWKQMAEDMGIAGLIIPEEHGGAGFGYVELLVVMEEMGRALLCSPYLGTAVQATQALLQCATEAAQKELLPEIAAGRRVVSLASAETNGRWDLTAIEMNATEGDSGVTLSGTKCLVLDGHSSDVLLVVARNKTGLGLFQVASDAKGLVRTSIPTLDLTRKLATVEFKNTPAKVISEGDQTAALERVMALTVTALAAEQVGGAQMCLEAGVEYAKTRLQFGRPIGSFQGIKHKCAEVLLEVELAKSAAYHACFSVAEEQNELLEMAAVAKSYCSEAYYRAAAENIQIHGGMGFTWEHPAHLYFKRAKASELLFGDPAYHRERLADQIGI